MHERLTEIGDPPGPAPTVETAELSPSPSDTAERRGTYSVPRATGGTPVAVPVAEQVDTSEGGV